MTGSRPTGAFDPISDIRCAPDRFQEMRRREFISALLGASVRPHAARAEQKRVPRIGFLATSLESPQARATLSAFYQGLREHDYIDGQNVLIEVRGADSKIERFRALASELVGLNLDVIVASDSVAARAVRQATTTIPIVVPVMGDPVGDGLVASLARPGGNIRGLTFLGPQLVPKRLALLKEALPKATKVAGLRHPGAYGPHTMKDMMNDAERAAQILGLELRLVSARGLNELDTAFSAIADERADALMVFPCPMLFAEPKTHCGPRRRAPAARDIHGQGVCAAEKALAAVRRNTEQDFE